MFKRLAIRFLCSKGGPFKNQAYFQSKHYVPREPVQQFLNKQRVSFKVFPNGFKLRECPFCPKPHNNQPTNLYTLNVQKESGYFHCFRCSSSGSYLDLKGKVLGIDDPRQRYSNSNSQITSYQHSYDNYQGQYSNNSYSQYGSVARIPPINQVQYFAMQQRLHSPQYADVKAYLTDERGLSEQTLNSYKVGAGSEYFVDQNGQNVQIKVIYFPMFQGVSEKERNKIKKQFNDIAAEYPKISNLKLEDWKINTQFAKIVKYKIRGGDADSKRFMRQYPSGSIYGFFGYNLVKEDTKQIVITEGEFDAMSVYQQTGIVALSLPQGASHLPDQLVPLLDRFQKVYLWMDNDQAGQLNAPKLTQKLGIKRTFIVENHDKTLKDANDFLRKKPELMSKLLSQALTIPGKNILRFDDLKSKLRFNIQNAEILQGIPSTIFPFFNKRVKGLRAGQFTILSGGTGTGKTTLLSQLSLDFCQQGVGTLWGSFQIKNDVLAQTMISQYSKVNFKKHKQKFQYYADKFCNLPLYWLNFYGSTDLDKVFGTIEYAIEKFDVSHVVIDTLQFLLSDQAQGYQKFDLQDQTVGRLRRIATEMNVHVTAVIHPKKVDEGQDLGIHSIFGSSKSAQQADNIWMIQNRGKFKILQVKKNRFDGQLGKVGLGFNNGIKSFFELTAEQVQKLHKGGSNMDEVVKARQSRKLKSEQQKFEQMLQVINPMTESYNDEVLQRTNSKKRGY